MGEGKFGVSGFGSESQRRSGQWDGTGNRSADWSSDRPDPSRDLVGGRLDDRGRAIPGGVAGGSNGGRLFRDDGREQGRGSDRRSGRDAPVELRPPLEIPRSDRGEGKLDRPGSRVERGESRLERGDIRMDRDRDVRLDRGERERVEGRFDRGDIRLDRGLERTDVRGLERVDSRGLERSDSRLERGGENRLERDDARMVDRRRDDPPLDPRGPRPGRGQIPVPVDIRVGLGRGIVNLSPDLSAFELERRGVSSQKDGGLTPRLGERELHLERDPSRVGMLPLGIRDRFEPPTVDFRLEDPRGDHRGFRDNLPETMLRDRHADERFGLPDPRIGRRFDDARDEKMLGRGGPLEVDRQRGGDILLPPRRSGAYELDRLPQAADLLSAQRRGPLLPTPPEEAPRRGGERRGEGYERDLPRAGRDVRDDRGLRRDQKEADFPPDLRDSRGRRDDFGLPIGSGRDFGGRGDHVWERDGDASKERDIGRDALLDSRGGGQRDQPLPRGRGRATPTEDVALDRDIGKRDRDKGRDPDADFSKRDRKDDADRGKESGRDKPDDTRSTRSADDARDRGKVEGGDASVPGKPGSARGARERDAQSDGKRSPARSQGGKERSPLTLSDRRKPLKRTRSLSPKQRNQTPPVQKADSLHSPVRARSPGRRVGDHLPSPLTSDCRARSRTPVGMKRKLDEELRSPVPKPKDDARSPITKRAREESRSPGRRGSRVPSPAGSHHSRGSHGSMEPRRRPGSGQRDDGVGRLFGQSGDRDSPARRDRDRDPAAKLEKSVDGRGDMDRKRGRSPISAQGRITDGSERGKKRWRGDGNWSETETAGDGTDRQKSSSVDPSARPLDITADVLDKSETMRMSLVVPLSGAVHPGHLDSFGAPGLVEGPMETRSEARPMPATDMDGRSLEGASQEGGDDSKDLTHMLLYNTARVTDEDDYEKISSDESDFEAEEGEKQTQNIVSVLDIDWASLAKEAPPKQTTGSLLKRFNPATVFGQIGVSKALAGSALFDKVKAICEEGLTIEGAKDKGDNKENALSDKPLLAGSKKERYPAPETGCPDLNTKLLSDVPVVHMAAVRQRRDRANLLRNLGPFRKALCARRDLEIRRQMCKVDKVYEQPADFPTHVMDTYLCKLSIQLFRQGRDFVDRKDSECDGKTELIM